MSLSPYAAHVTRLLGALGLLAPVALVVLVVLALRGGLSAGGEQAAIAVAGGLLAGIAFAAAIVSLWLRACLVPVVRSVEQIADGDLDVTVPALRDGIDRAPCRGDDAGCGGPFGVP